MSDQAETNPQVAERIAGMFVEQNVPLVAIGAVALAAHGHVRFTEDIDLGVINVSAPFGLVRVINLFDRAEAEILV